MIYLISVCANIDYKVISKQVLLKKNNLITYNNRSFFFLIKPKISFLGCSVNIKTIFDWLPSINRTWLIVYMYALLHCRGLPSTISDVKVPTRLGKALVSNKLNQCFVFLSNHDLILLIYKLKKRILFKRFLDVTTITRGVLSNDCVILSEANQSLIKRCKFIVFFSNTVLYFLHFACF